MQIGYSSCGILQFVSRIDSIKIPAVYDVRPKEESFGSSLLKPGVHAKGIQPRGRADTSRYDGDERRAATCPTGGDGSWSPFKGSGLFVCRISSVFGPYRMGSMAFNETMMETRPERKRRVNSFCCSFLP